MRTAALVFVLMLGSCGPGSETEDVTEETSGDDTLAGEAAGHNEVCRSGELSGSPAVDRPCARGLQCCYPCGIEGCDSVCHTPAECEMDRMRP